MGNKFTSFYGFSGVGSLWIPKTASEEEEVKATQGLNYPPKKLHLLSHQTLGKSWLAGPESAEGIWRRAPQDLI